MTVTKIYYTYKNVRDRRYIQCPRQINTQFKLSFRFNYYFLVELFLFSVGRHGKLQLLSIPRSSIISFITFIIYIFLDSERSQKFIGFTMMCAFFF